MPAHLRWRICDVAGRTLRRGDEAIKATALANRKVATLDLSELLKKHETYDLLVYLELAARGQPTSTNLVTFSRPKHMDLAHRPGIQATVQARGGQELMVTLQARKPALWAWLDLGDIEASLSDNFVHLLPGMKARILVRPKGELTPRKLREQLTVRSLVDTYT